MDGECMVCKLDMLHKNLFLGIRQYDCNLKEENFKDLIDIAYKSSPTNDSSGHQTLLFDTDDSIKLLRESFRECCRDYFKVNRDDEVRLWFYQDWIDNPRRNGQYWHNHPCSFYALSAVMYLTLPEDSSTTGFSLDTNNGSIGSYELFSDMMYLPKEINKWFIFPNWIPHYPGQCNSQERRICIGADYQYK